MRRIIEEILPSIKVHFLEEKPGCDLFATNRLEHFPERYLLDSYDEAIKCESDIVGLPIEPSVEAIDPTLDHHLDEYESNETWYRFH